MKEFFLKKNFAFTMAEAILVMTILGIIATIMISTLKPAEFKEKALLTMAKKVMSEIDNATTLILINKPTGTIEYGYFSFESNPEGDWIDQSVTYEGTSGLWKVDYGYYDDANFLSESTSLISNMYKEYLTVLRRCDCTSPITNTFNRALCLKDGSCVVFGMAPGGGEIPSVFPGESTISNTANATGYIYFDTNGDKEPNAYSKDRFVLPVDSTGAIIYDED